MEKNLKKKIHTHIYQNHFAVQKKHNIVNQLPFDFKSV